MRALLGVLNETRHPFSIVTKNALICRDLDLLKSAAAGNRVRVAISVTTLDPVLARRMEPRASAPEKRLTAIRTLADAGVPVSVLIAPIIPALTDNEIEAITARAAEAGARAAGSVLLRLPLEIKDLFREWLEAHYPDRAERVLSLVRQTRDGRLNDPDFGSRMRGTGPYAEMIRTRLALARRRHGLDRRTLGEMDCTAFTPPRKPSAQMDLF